MFAPSHGNSLINDIQTLLLYSRNIRLGLTSVWFNPPWCCMKVEYVMLSLLIPRPKSLGNKIDVYLQPWIEELKVLRHLWVETYNASLEQTFQMRATLLWIISYFPRDVMLSGWSTKGKFACLCGNYNTNLTYLKHSQKMLLYGLSCLFAYGS